MKFREKISRNNFAGNPTPAILGPLKLRTRAVLFLWHHEIRDQLEDAASAASLLKEQFHEQNMTYDIMKLGTN